MRTATMLLALGVLGCSGAPADMDSGTPPADGGPRDAAMTEMDASLPDSGPPDAGPEPCATEGMTRTVACGNCGLASEQCTGGVWSRTSACLDEGECGPGMVQTEPLARCGERQRICNDMCMWRDWTMTAPQGECEVGERQLVTTSACGMGFQPQLCSDTCVWQDDGACDDGCGSTARTTPEWAREVCIPAGPFVRGHDSSQYDRPAATIQVSAFYIDVYPATNRRYIECVNASACTAPVLARGPAYTDPARADYPVQGLEFAQAEAFCAWDGRGLPTAAQWEKAARGPAPRAQRWVWDEDAYRCDLVLGGACPGGPTGPGTNFLPIYTYDGLPGSRSYYGTYQQYGGMLEWLSTSYDRDYYSTPESLLPDPGPTSGTLRTSMGTTAISAGPTAWITQRWGSSGSGSAVSSLNGVRCARAASP